MRRFAHTIVLSSTDAAFKSLRKKPGTSYNSVIQHATSNIMSASIDFRNILNLGKISQTLKCKIIGPGCCYGLGETPAQESSVCSKSPPFHISE